MAQLNQIIAVEKDIKNKTHDLLTVLHRNSQKLPLLSGIARAYQPKDEDGETLPPESTRVQLRLDDVLENIASTMTRLLDVTLTKDAANCIAKADVVVGGVTVLTDVPVTYLIFLEKKLVNLHNIVRELPTLDPSSEWHFDENTNNYATDPVRTTRTKKIPRNHVVSEATERHPAQVQVYHEDVVAGEWTTIRYSGALKAKRVSEILGRIEALQAAVKFAREKANSVEIEQHKAGKSIFDFLFAV